MHLITCPDVDPATYDVIFLSVNKRGQHDIPIFYRDVGTLVALFKATVRSRPHRSHNRSVVRRNSGIDKTVLRCGLSDY
jgi:hypothetical protein